MSIGKGILALTVALLSLLAVCVAVLLWVYRKPSKNIHEAAQSGNVAAVERFLRQGIPVDLRGDGGMTPLHEAMGCGPQLDVARLLLSKGADVNARDERGNTALWWGVNAEAALLVLNRGAKVDAQGKYGGTALHQAAANGMRPKIAVLLEHGADVRAADESGYTALHSLASNSTRLETTDFPGSAELLIRSGADVNARETTFGYTPLHLAARSGSTDVVRILLAKGASVNARDDLGQTPLHKATAYRGGSALVKLLLGYGANPEARDKLGKTPIEYAKAKGKEGIVQMMLKAMKAPPGKD